MIPVCLHEKSDRKWKEGQAHPFENHPNRHRQKPPALRKQFMHAKGYMKLLPQDGAVVPLQKRHRPYSLSTPALPVWKKLQYRARVLQLWQPCLLPLEGVNLIYWRLGFHFNFIWVPQIVDLLPHQNPPLKHKTQKRKGPMISVCAHKGKKSGRSQAWSFKNPPDPHLQHGEKPYWESSVYSVLYEMFSTWWQWCPRGARKPQGSSLRPTFLVRKKKTPLQRQSAAAVLPSSKWSTLRLQPLWAFFSNATSSGWGPTPEL